jgi:hypothetical protein
MSITSQALTVLGLCFEFVSGITMIRKLFYGYYKRLDDMGRPFQTHIRQDKKEGALVLTFLIIGMILQGLAVLY